MIEEALKYCLENKGNNKLIWKHWKDGIAGNGDGKLIYLIKIDGMYTLSPCLSFECDYIELSELDKLLSENQGEQKLAWNEEDEHKIKDIIYFLDTAKKHYASTVELDACIDWLKSLKNRVLPQSKQEWSEEDEKHSFILEQALFSPYAYGTKKNKKDASDWLKSLKDRVQSQSITVTDEELAQAKKDAYNDALDKIEYHSGEPTFDDGWNAAIWYLKKNIHQMTGITFNLNNYGKNKSF